MQPVRISYRKVPMIKHTYYHIYALCSSPVAINDWRAQQIHYTIWGKGCVCVWMPMACRWKSEILVGGYVSDYHNVSIHFYQADRGIVFLKNRYPSTRLQGVFLDIAVESLPQITHGSCTATACFRSQRGSLTISFSAHATRKGKGVP